MHRFTSPPIINPGRSGDYARADLIFYGVEHRGPSFEARVFFNFDGTPDEHTPRDSEQFAGSFTVFGHGGCAGDVGHCDVPPGPLDLFDRRPPHPLVPQTKVVIVTDALRFVAGDEVVVSVIAVGPSASGPVAIDELAFQRLALVTYS
jgi:tyrosinase